MAVYLGRDAAIGIGEESTWGTAVARARYAQIKSSNLKRNVEWATVSDLGDNGTSLVSSAYFEVGEKTSGNVALNANYDSYLLTGLLKHAMGANVDAGAGPYTHTLTMASSLPVGLTVEVFEGTGASEVYEGCKVNKLTLACAVGEVMTLTPEFMGETSGGPAALGTPTIPSSPTYVMHHNAGVMTINGVTYTIKSMELVIDNKLADRQQLGANTTLEPQRGDHAEVVINVTLERVSNALKTLFQAGTQADASITWTSTTKSIAITLHNAVAFAYDCPITRVGPLEETLTLRGLRSSSKTGLGIVVTNANATAI